MWLGCIWQLVGYLTEEPEVPGSVPGLASGHLPLFPLLLIQEGQLSATGTKYGHLLLVNHLKGRKAPCAGATDTFG